jgi:tetratricopeptide (TPR) repeat protein
MSDLNQRYRAAEKLMDGGQLEEAASALQAMLADDESFVMAHLALARVLTKLGKHLEAVAHSQRACDIEPSDPFNFTALSVTAQRAWAGTQDRRFIQMAEDAKAQAHMLAGHH